MSELEGVTWYQAWEARLLDRRPRYRRYSFVRPLGPPSTSREMVEQQVEAHNKRGQGGEGEARVRQIWPHDEGEELNKGTSG